MSFGPEFVTLEPLENNDIELWIAINIRLTLELLCL